MLKRWPPCTANEQTLQREIDHLFDSEGAKAVASTLSPLETKCPGLAKRGYAVAAWLAAIRADCESARRFARLGEEDIKPLCE